MPVMLYKHPGPHRIHDDWFDYTIVEAEDVPAKHKEGWSVTTPEAKAKATAKPAAKPVPKPVAKDEPPKVLKIAVHDEVRVSDKVLKGK